MSLLLPETNPAARAEAERLANGARSKYERAWDEIYTAFTARPGRPHLRMGTAALLRHPAALAVAVLQTVLALLGALAITAAAYGRLDWSDTAALAFFLSLTSASNVLWVFMAASIAGIPPTARALFAAPMGWLPLRFVAWLFVPAWLSPGGSWRGVIAAQARMMQAGVAYSLAVRRPADLVLLDASKVMWSRAPDVLDGLSSYIMYPVLALISFFLPMSILSDFGAPDWMHGLVLPFAILHGLVFFTWGFGFVLYVMWIAYNRAALFAMMFALMNDARNDTETVAPYPEWSGRYYKRLAAMVLAVAAISVGAAVYKLVDASWSEYKRRTGAPPYIGNEWVPPERRGVVVLPPAGALADTSDPYRLIRFHNPDIPHERQYVSPRALHSSDYRLAVPAGTYRVSTDCFGKEHLLDPAFVVARGGTTTFTAPTACPQPPTVVSAMVRFAIPAPTSEAQRYGSALRFEDAYGGKTSTPPYLFKEISLPIGNYRVFAVCYLGEEKFKEYLVQPALVVPATTVTLSLNPLCHYSDQ